MEPAAACPVLPQHAAAQHADAAAGRLGLPRAAGSAWPRRVSAAVAAAAAPPRGRRRRSERYARPTPQSRRAGGRAAPGAAAGRRAEVAGAAAALGSTCWVPEPGAGLRAAAVCRFLGPGPPVPQHLRWLRA